MARTFVRADNARFIGPHKKCGESGRYAAPAGAAPVSFLVTAIPSHADDGPGVEDVFLKGVATIARLASRGLGIGLYSPWRSLSGACSCLSVRAGLIGFSVCACTVVCERNRWRAAVRGALRRRLLCGAVGPVNAGCHLSTAPMFSPQARCWLWQPPSPKASSFRGGDQFVMVRFQHGDFIGLEVTLKPGSACNRPI